MGGLRGYIFNDVLPKYLFYLIYNAISIWTFASELLGILICASRISMSARIVSLLGSMKNTDACRQIFCFS